MFPLSVLLLSLDAVCGLLIIKCKIGLYQNDSKFIRFALSRLPWLNSMILPPYIDRCKLLDIQPLQLRLINFDCILIFDLLLWKIYCPSLLEKLSLNVCNYNFRSSTRSLLSTGVHRTNYAYNAPFERAIRKFSDKEHCLFVAKPYKFWKHERFSLLHFEKFPLFSPTPNLPLS